MSDYDSDRDEQEEQLTNVRPGHQAAQCQPPQLTLLPPCLPVQPDVVTKYKAAAKITNSERLGAGGWRCMADAANSAGGGDAAPGAPPLRPLSARNAQLPQMHWRR